MNNRQYGGLDWGRMAAALLVIAIHTSPLTAYSAEADWFFTRVLARTAVPLFFIISGFFLLPAYLFTDKPDEQAQKRIPEIFPEKRQALFCGSAALLSAVRLLRRIVSALQSAGLAAAFAAGWHLLSSLVFSRCSHCGDAALFSASMAVAGPTNRIGAVFYTAQTLGDSYYGLAQQLGLLSAFYTMFFQVCSYTRNGFFMAPIFLLMGAWMGRETEQKHWQSERLHLIDLLPAWLLFIAEACLLRSLGWPRHDSMYLCLLPVLYGLFQLLLQWHVSAPPVLRPLSAAMYVLHPLVIVLVRGIAKLLGLTALLVENSFLHYWTVCLSSVLLSLFWIHLQAIWNQRKRRTKTHKDG